MNDEGKDDLERFRELLGTRLRSALVNPPAAGFRSRPAAAGSASGVERWADGEAKDEETRILERFDEARFQSGDVEYQNRPQVLKDAARLVELRRQRRAKEPHPESKIEVPEGTPKAIADAMQSQEAFEKGRAGLTKAERLAEIERGIAALEERRAALTEGGEE